MPAMIDRSVSSRLVELNTKQIPAVKILIGVYHAKLVIGLFTADYIERLAFPEYGQRE